MDKNKVVSHILKNYSTDDTLAIVQSVLENVILKETSILTEAKKAKPKSKLKNPVKGAKDVVGGTAGAKGCKSGAKMQPKNTKEVMNRLSKVIGKKAPKK